MTLIQISLDHRFVLKPGSYILVEKKKNHPSSATPRISVFYFDLKRYNVFRMLGLTCSGSNDYGFHVRKIQDVKFSCKKSVSVFLGFPINKNSPLSKSTSIGSVNLTFHIYKITPETESFCR